MDNANSEHNARPVDHKYTYLFCTLSDLTNFQDDINEQLQGVFTELQTCHQQIRELQEEVSNLRDHRQRPHSGRKKTPLEIKVRVIQQFS